jgi:phage virion morphogenesis protein
MSGIFVHVSHDDSSIRAAMMGVIALGQNPAPIMRDLAAYGESSTRDRFHTETDPDGKPWKKSLRAQISGGKTLTKAGHLGDSITSDSGRDWAAWGSNMIYARIHQLGGVIKPKVAGGKLRFRLANGAFVSVAQITMPKRGYLGVNKDDEAEMISLVHRRIRGAAHAG